ncbi:MAG: glucokinase [Burkholderiales bacterium]
MALLLAADIGGTKANLWLYELHAGRRDTRAEASLPSADFADAQSMLAVFARGARVDAAAVAIAAPVIAARAAPPNLPWIVEQAAIADALGTPRVELLNDLAATAIGIDALAPDRLHTLNAGQHRTGPVVLIAAGTGLGEAAIIDDGGRRIVLPTEGGHADFAPGSAEDIALLQYLSARHPHVSWERVVSGPGLAAIHAFILEREHGRDERPADLRDEQGDPAAAITRLALIDRDAAAVAALDMFVRLYGAEAGNLALKFLATGGVYVAGGIAPKILAHLDGGRFMQGFVAKGRHADLMAGIPVHVVLEPKTALLGAARRAEALASAAAIPGPRA